MLLKRQSVRSFGKDERSFTPAIRLLDRNSFCSPGHAKPSSDAMALKLRFNSMRLIK